MFDPSADSRIRSAAFDWLARQAELHPLWMPRELLAQGTEIEGKRVRLLGAQGIFKPAVLDLPISITTSPKGPYDDDFDDDHLLTYRYRGTDPFHRDNVGLREVMRRRLPLAYFHGVAPGRYVAVWPVFIVGDDVATLAFKVAHDDPGAICVGDRSSSVASDDLATEVRRRYLTTTMRRRLHQRTFRERVLTAYRNQCAFCRFRHDELLDAAHIIEDREERGEPIVSNGLSLCKLHHAAYDRGFIGVRPDLFLEVRPDILRESDGPTLKHAIQGLHEKKIWVPRRQELRPAPDRLEVRYKRFLGGS